MAKAPDQATPASRSDNPLDIGEVLLEQRFKKPTQLIVAAVMQPPSDDDPSRFLIFLVCQEPLAK